MSKLQLCSESNYAAIFQMNSLSGNIFFSFKLDFFFGNWEKRRIFWIGNGAYIRPLLIGRKGPGMAHKIKLLQLPKPRNVNYAQKTIRDIDCRLVTKVF